MLCEKRRVCLAPRLGFTGLRIIIYVVVLGIRRKSRLMLKDLLHGQHVLSLDGIVIAILEGGNVVLHALVDINLALRHELLDGVVRRVHLRVARKIVQCVVGHLRTARETCPVLCVGVCQAVRRLLYDLPVFRNDDLSGGESVIDLRLDNLVDEAEAIVPLVLGGGIEQLRVGNLHVK